jgi:hypothetical protein
LSRLHDPRHTARHPDKRRQPRHHPRWRHYADLGATVTGPQADINLCINTFLNGKLVSNIVLETSQVTTDTIDYVATRTILIEPAALPPTISPSAAVAATSTEATSTAQ